MTMTMMMDFKVLCHFFFFFLAAAAASPAAAKLYVVTLYYLNTTTKSFLSLSSVINEKIGEKRDPTVGINFATLKFSSSTRPPPPPILARDETAFVSAVVLVPIDF